MHSLSPADELADLRADISRLKLLESALRTKILASPETNAIGRWHRIEVLETKRLVFDATLLPAALRDDPRYYRDRVTQIVRVLPVEVRRPGWPIQRGQTIAHQSGPH